MGPRAGLDMCGKSRPNRDSIPDRPPCSSVALPTELSGPQGVLFPEKFMNFYVVVCSLCVDIQINSYGANVSVLIVHIIWYFH